MIETNARILAPGMNIALPVRRIRVQDTTNTPELREKVCYRLRQDSGLVGVPCQDEKGMLLVVTDTALAPRRMTVDEWTLDLTDTDEATLLNLHTSEGRQLLPELIGRMMTHAIAKKDRGGHLTARASGMRMSDFRRERVLMRTGASNSRFCSSKMWA